MSHQQTLSELAELLNGSLHGEGDRVIKSLASISNAAGDDLTYLDNIKFEKELETTKACCVLVDRDIKAPESLNIIRVDQPLAAWAAILELFHPRKRLFEEVSPAAHMGNDVTTGEGVGIGPGAWVGDGACIESNTEIYPGATVGPGAVIGENCIIYPGAHVYHDCRIGNRVIIHSGAVIGGDGFGFAHDGKGWHKIAQLGGDVNAFVPANVEQALQSKLK